MTNEQATSLAAGLTYLSQKAGLVCVVEGLPSQTKPTEQQFAALVGKPLPALLLLEQLASVYGYSVQPSGQIYLLYQTHSDVADLPAMTVEECIVALTDVQRVLNRYNPQLRNGQIGSDPLMKPFADSLTKEQLTKMRGAGLPASELTPDQNRTVSRIGYYFYIQQNLQHIADVKARLAFASEKDSSIYYRKDLNQELICEYLQPATGQKNVLSLGSKIPPGNRKFGSGSSTTVQGKVSTIGSYLSQADLANRSYASYLAQKPLAIYENSRSDTSVLLPAVARLYGLQVLQKKEGKTHLTRKAVRPLTSLQDIPSVIPNLLPLPLTQAIKNQFEIVSEQERKATSSKTPFSRPSIPEMVRVRALRQYVADVQAEAVKQFETYLLRKFANADSRVTFADLDATGNVLLANLLLAQALPTLQKLYQPVPLYLSEESTNVITGDILPSSDKGDSRREFRFTLCKLGGPESNGLPVPMVGFITKIP